MHLRSRVCLLFMYSQLMSIPAQANSDLPNSGVSELENKIWDKYQKLSIEDRDRLAQHTQRALVFGDKVMNFSLERIGEPGPQGYPVYIALHGGGGAPAPLNDSQWRHMQIYYKSSVQFGIYVAPRGVTNTWDLHFVDESYPLYDRLIENLIVYEGADPERIYLLGFSAGGDGVYQITPRMPDRWAAANMSAGHHNWIAFDNLRNTPFLIQVGEMDNAYHRNTVAAQNYVQLQTLQKRYGGFTSEAFIHFNGWHNGWGDNNASQKPYTVIKDPQGWLQTKDRSTIQANTNAARWLQQWRRSTSPDKLIWDLNTRAPRPRGWGARYAEDPSSLFTQKGLFYWLAVDERTTAGRIEIKKFPQQNLIQIYKAEGVKTFYIRVKSNEFDFSKPIKVMYQDRVLTETSLQVKESVMMRTLFERGDRNFVYQDEIAVEIPQSLEQESETNESSTDMFSYCSDGRCFLMSGDAFHRSKGFPLEMHYTCKKPHQYALTFDDGPSQNTERLLDILNRHQVKATFFVVGSNLASEEGQARLRWIHLHGHQVSNHTKNHVSLPELNDDEIRAQVQDTQKQILSVLGDSAQLRRDSSVVRPPFGNMSSRVQDVFKGIGFSSVRWNADRYDWREKASDLIRSRYLQQLNFIRSQSGDIQKSILDLNHETSDVTLSVLDEMIPKIKSEGYEFVTVSECIGL